MRHREDSRILKYNGLRIRIPPENFGGFYSICYGGYYDPILDSLQPSDIVVDGGANVGAFSLLASRRAKRVYAVEPNRRNFALLQENLRENNVTNVIPINAAISGSPGGSHLVGEGEGGHLSATGESVATITLDSLSDPEMSVIKLDIEGAEPLAFDGLTFSSSLRMVCFELDCHGLQVLYDALGLDHRANPNYEGVLKKLLQEGFVLRGMAGFRFHSIRKLMSLAVIRNEFLTGMFGFKFFLRSALKGDNILDPHGYENFDMVYAYRATRNTSIDDIISGVLGISFDKARDLAHEWKEHSLHWETQWRDYPDRQWPSGKRPGD